MSWALASHSTLISDYRRHRVGNASPPPENNHVRLRIPGFSVAPYDPPPPLSQNPRQPKICIIGAGMSGLFSALLLQKAGIQDITILECQDRVGGRVHTQYFSEKKEEKLYGELGAMRLPVTPEHQMVFDTIDYLNERIPEDDRIHLINFIFSNDNGLYFYNDSRDNGQIGDIAWANDSQNFNKLGFASTVNPDYQTLLKKAMGDFIDALNSDFDSGLDYLLKFDQHSVYSYLKEVYFPSLDPNLNQKYNVDETIGAMEMTESATGLFRLSFVEAVMDAYTFSKVSQEWKTIDNGMQRFPNAFPLVYANEKRGKVDVKYKCKVYKLENIDVDGILKLRVHWEENGSDNVRVFDRVIITCPLGVVRHWELPELKSLEDPKTSDNFYYKRRAIRELNYDNSAKIFLKFNSRFWENQTDSPIVGGSSTTDLPIRTVIYPSYYVGMPIDKPAILLGSYTWANDAAKFAPYSQQENARLCIKDLKILHGDQVEKEWDSDPKYNSSIYWPNDPTTVGAFALFGPGQYSDLIYPMIKPMYNIHWAGEYTDIHHAWIVGALNSAVRVVKEILIHSAMEEEWRELINEQPLKNWHGHLEDGNTTY
ncbi:6634_t:CDS:2 [Entrophospora sp. SA101]|nr:2094_t:CDS:2 [Entrophospora sp. SA101]CAJ0752094.1 24647_t:CDS:2 [Entrophospora sp. SA101]CAJ0763763.1 2759_t:CDS:2 [Entrophospora sp. SA101]CAJ0764743.1 6634_t:CDS:2 [Entrophospora sp. SA101]